MTTLEIFAQNLKKLRVENDMSLKELANDLDTTAQSLSLYEKAERTINIDLLVKIAKRFNVSSDYLLGIADKPGFDADFTSVRNYIGISSDALSAIIKAANSFPNDMFNDFISNYLSDILFDISNALVQLDNSTLLHFNTFYGEKSFESEIKPNCKELTQEEIKRAYIEFVKMIYNWKAYDAANHVKKYIEKNTDIQKFEENAENMSAELYKYFVEEDPDNGEHNPKNE